ncbi:MAG: DUF4838 domain-containing protein [Ruminococcaceae bacterium]|nr:DUF4838 domain-containing protein [Oscillospiraceae bacterium]
MYEIKKIRADHVIDFAAEELKEYLRMMMPECGDIDITYDPKATDGFRLGLLEDFGLENEADDPVLDDVVHIDTDEKGGILAGSNPRSVLFAVYRFLRLNGCRWLYPGVDGDYVPVKDIEPQKYHKKADHRFRGHCNEGAESQQCMLETIDFYAKQEINIYMIEFDNPFFYYDSYYDHVHNRRYRPSEKVSPQIVMQWKRQCEAEIAKRGLQFHDMGHGWTAEPFGLSSTDGWRPNHNLKLTDKQRSYLAEIDGVRAPFHGICLNTNLCMSNPEVRTIMATGIADYAEKHKNVTYLHVWLADSNSNHCECAECQKMRPSDFYLMIMNEVDELLTARGLDTRVVFIAYYDTLFAPEHVKITNPKRFSLLYAPITRTYSESITADSKLPPLQPYIRNAWKKPKGAEENLVFLKSWQEIWDGPCFSYEYHFWRHQYMDPGGLYIARRIFEDIRGLKYMGLDGFVEDGSQRSFWPNGLAIYVYAEALLNEDVTFEELVEDYFSHIYGADWKEARDYLQKVSNAFDFSFIAGEKSKNTAISTRFDPDRKEAFEAVHELAAECRAMVAKHMSMPTRPQTVSWRLLLKHAEYCIGIADFMKEKCLGHNAKALELAEEFFAEYGKYEIELERYYDHYLAAKSYLQMVRKPAKFVLQAGNEG